MTCIKYKLYNALYVYSVYHCQSLDKHKYEYRVDTCLSNAIQETKWAFVIKCNPRIKQIWTNNYV